MHTITLTKRELKNVVRESVQEALSEEMMNLRALLTPYISEKEQEDIERRYEKPTRKILRSKSLNI